MNQESLTSLSQNVSYNSSNITDIKYILNSSDVSIPFIQTGTGYIDSSGILRYTHGTLTKSNQIMIINDLSEYGLNIKDTVKFIIGTTTGTDCVIGFHNNTITESGAVLLMNIIRCEENDTIKSITTTIPINTVSIIIFNRYPINNNPEIYKFSKNLKDQFNEIENQINQLIDTQLLDEGKAADAKETGDRIRNLESYLNGEVISIPYIITGTGYISSNGALVYTAGTTSQNNQIMVINDLSEYNLEPGKWLRVVLGYSDGTAGCICFHNSNIEGSISKPLSVVPWVYYDEGQTIQTVKCKIPKETTSIAIFNRKINNPNPTIEIYTKIELNLIVDDLGEDINILSSEVENLTTKVYKSCVNKPMDFNNKKLLFFGDSITYGYIAASDDVPSHQAENQYPKIFAQGVNASSFTNRGVSGATLVDTEGYVSIFSRLKAVSLDSDYLFIAGGVNDWSVGVDGTTFKNGMEDICSFLKNNYNGEVIFITPIPEAGKKNNTPKQTLQEVRNIITRTALKYGFSVVQGTEFPFPTENDDADYISLMFQDKLHPTELGYHMYAQALRSILC